MSWKCIVSIFWGKQEVCKEERIKPKYGYHTAIHLFTCYAHLFLFGGNSFFTFRYYDRCFRFISSNYYLRYRRFHIFPSYLFFMVKKNNSNWLCLLSGLYNFIGRRKKREFRIGVTPLCPSYSLSYMLREVHAKSWMYCINFYLNEGKTLYFIVRNASLCFVVTVCIEMSITANPIHWVVPQSGLRDIFNPHTNMKFITSSSTLHIIPWKITFKIYIQKSTFRDKFIIKHQMKFCVLWQ